MARALSAVRRFPTVRRKRPAGLSGQLIVSLTSYPPRFATLSLTLRSLLDQSTAADRTILWIAQSDMGQLPKAVRNLEQHGLEIRSCPDLRSYKKLIPTLHAFPDAWIATADDDVYYPPDWLARLVAASDPGGSATVGGRVHLARFDAFGRALPYGDWDFDVQIDSAPDGNCALFPTGVGGILYPPGCFSPEVYDEQAFQALCPHGDDIWFFAMSRRAGVTQRRSAGRSRLLYWPSSQDHALWLENLEGRNDAQITALEGRYGPLGVLDSLRPTSSVHG